MSTTSPWIPEPPLMAGDDGYVPPDTQDAKITRLAVERKVHSRLTPTGFGGTGSEFRSQMSAAHWRGKAALVLAAAALAGCAAPTTTYLDPALRVSHAGQVFTASEATDFDFSQADLQEAGTINPVVEGFDPTILRIDGIDTRQFFLLRYSPDTGERAPWILLSNAQGAPDVLLCPYFLPEKRPADCGTAGQFGPASAT